VSGWQGEDMKRQPLFELSTLDPGRSDSFGGGKMKGPSERGRWGDEER
jgi:hypothetical protein